MFGESKPASEIGPGRRGLRIGLAVGCLLLATGAVLVSGTADGLNLFGSRLPDTTPSLSDPPSATADAAALAPAPTPVNENARNVSHVHPAVSKPAPTPVAVTGRPDAPGGRSSDLRRSIPAAPGAPNRTPADPKSSPPPISRNAPPLSVKTTPMDAPAKPAPPPPCARSGFAAVLDTTGEPVGTALARSLGASDLQARIIEFGDDTFRLEDADRVLAGDGSAVMAHIKEGTLLIAQLKIQERRLFIAEAPMTEVSGTMDLAIVRNNCGTIAVQRHRDISGRSVNERLEDGTRGLGEIFKEKIVDLVKK